MRSIPHGNVLRWRCALVAGLAVACLFGSPLPLAGQGSGGVNRASQRRKPYVVLVSFDAFRADYLDSLRPPNFARVMRQGVRATGLIPVFPTKTFPNHLSIITGLYAEHHGIVANSFYDPARKARFALADTNAVRDGSWYRGEPLWVTAERQGMVSASFQWPGSEAAIGGVRPTMWTRYDGTVPDSVRADSVLAWLSLPPERRPHFVSLYVNDVDEAGHRHGPGSPEVADAVIKVDRMLGRLLDGIDALPIRDSVYLILVSDHGMQRYDPRDYTSLATLIDTTGVRIADAGPNANLHVTGGLARARIIRDSLNRALRSGRAYLRADVPARLHYRGDPRVGDVVVVLDQPFQVGAAPEGARNSRGAHGWDPVYPEMHGIFLVTGPGVRRGRQLPDIQNIDIYSYMAELLRLRPAKQIDGRAGRLWTLVMRRQR